MHCLSYASQSPLTFILWCIFCCKEILFITFLLITSPIHTSLTITAPFLTSLINTGPSHASFLTTYITKTLPTTLYFFTPHHHCLIHPITVLFLLILTFVLPAFITLTIAFTYLFTHLTTLLTPLNSLYSSRNPPYSSQLSLLVSQPSLLVSTLLTHLTTLLTRLTVLFAIINPARRQFASHLFISANNSITIMSPTLEKDNGWNPRAFVVFAK